MSAAGMLLSKRSTWRKVPLFRASSRAIRWDFALLSVTTDCMVPLKEWKLVFLGAIISVVLEV